VFEKRVLTGISGPKREGENNRKTERNACREDPELYTSQNIIKR
jgi:hypothetical protein